MKTALLVCDHVPPFLREKHGDYPTMYQKLFTDLELHSFYVCDHDFPNLENFDLFIITGSRFSVYDEIDWVEDLKAFIRLISKNGKKCIGICFGHQIIADALGGKVEKSDVGFLIGVHTFKMIDQPAWIKEQKSHFNVLMLCQDQVTEVPQGSEVIATNPLCPIGMYQIGHQFFAIQGHPEFTKEYDRDVFISRREKIGQNKIDQASESFGLDPDQRFLHSVMMDFLREKMSY